VSSNTKTVVKTILEEFIIGVSFLFRANGLKQLIRKVLRGNARSMGKQCEDGNPRGRLWAALISGWSIYRKREGYVRGTSAKAQLQ
jgi:hypothetical protein